MLAQGRTQTASTSAAQPVAATHRLQRQTLHRRRPRCAAPPLRVVSPPAEQLASSSALIVEADNDQLISSSPDIPSTSTPWTDSSSSTSTPWAEDDAPEQPPGPAGAFLPGQEAAARQKLFNRIAPVYDELNERLSFGQHRVWKRMAVRWSGAAPGGTALDVCCGSGDLAFELARAVGPSGRVVGLDFAAEMLEDAESRRTAAAATRPATRPLPQMTWVQGDALALPFPDASFDAATMGYGLRNVADVPQALAELARVLKPGASVAVLDFNNSQDMMVDGVQAFFLERLVVPAAAAYGLSAEYEYLRPSIKAFPTGREQEEMALAAGFATARHHDVSFGLMGCLVATKARF